MNYSSGDYASIASKYAEQASVAGEDDLATAVGKGAAAVAFALMALAAAVEESKPQQ